MPIEIKVPVLPESVSDALMMAWHKQAGEAVARDETLVALATDKVVLEVPAPESGVLAEIVRQTGETVQSGDVIARLTNDIFMAGRGLIQVFMKLLREPLTLPQKRGAT